MNRIEYKFKLNDIQEEVFKRTSMLARGENAAKYNDLVLSRGEEFMFNPYVETIASEAFDFIAPFCREKYNIWKDLEEQENPTEPDPLIKFGMSLDRAEDYLAIDRVDSTYRLAPTTIEDITGDHVIRHNDYNGTKIYANLKVSSKDIKPGDIFVCRVKYGYAVKPDEVPEDGAETNTEKAEEPKAITLEQGVKIKNLEDGVEYTIELPLLENEDLIKQEEYFVRKCVDGVNVINNNKLYLDAEVLDAWFDLYGDDFTVIFDETIGWNVNGEALDFNLLQSYNPGAIIKESVRFYRYTNYRSSYRDIDLLTLEMLDPVIITESADKLNDESYLFIGDSLWYKFNEFEYKQTNRDMDTLMYCTLQLDWFDTNAIDSARKAIFEALVNGIIYKWISILGDNTISAKYQILYDSSLTNMRNRINTQKKPVRRRYKYY